MTFLKEDLEGSLFELAMIAFRVDKYPKIFASLHNEPNSIRHTLCFSFYGIADFL